MKLPTRLTKIGSRAFYLSGFEGTLDVSNVIYIQGKAFNLSKFVRVIRGSVEMTDGSVSENQTGIHPKDIKSANGSYYNGSNDN